MNDTGSPTTKNRLMAWLDFARLGAAIGEVVLGFGQKLAAAFPPTATFVRRWSAMLVLIPLMLALMLAGWAFFAQLDPRIAVDNPFAFVLELPAIGAYAFAAIGTASAVKLLLWSDIPRKAEDALNKAAAEGSKGARWILIKDRIEWTVLLIIFVIFYWPAR